MADIFDEINRIFKKQNAEKGLKSILKHILEHEKLPPGLSEMTKKFVKQNFKEILLEKISPCSRQIKKEVDDAIDRDDFGFVIDLYVNIERLREYIKQEKKVEK